MAAERPVEGAGRRCPRRRRACRGAWGISASEENPPRHAPRRARSLPTAALMCTAAAFALAIIGVLALGWHRYVAIEQASYRTSIGGMRDVQLSDGTQITLSSNSSVLVTYSHRARLIELEHGEAFFKVVSDTDRPFEVRAGGRSAIAVGTRYGVRRDDGNLRVVVTQGVVRLESGGETNDRSRPTTLLPAGSIALASDAGVMVRSGSVQEAEELLDWRRGFITFHDTPLASAVAEFNRYNVRKIVIGDASVGTLLIGGNFRWSNADAFVRLLEQAFPVRAMDSGDTIVLKAP